MWHSYANTSGKSGVSAYLIGAQSIAVRFKTGTSYTYTHQSCGEATVGHMKVLARGGKGLSTYISRNKPAYAARV